MDWLIFVFGMVLGASVALVIFGLLSAARDAGYPGIEDVDPGVVDALESFERATVCATDLLRRNSREVRYAILRGQKSEEA